MLIKIEEKESAKLCGWRGFVGYMHAHSDQRKILDPPQLL